MTKERVFIRPGSNSLFHPRILDKLTDSIRREHKFKGVCLNHYKFYTNDGKFHLCLKAWDLPFYRSCLYGSQAHRTISAKASVPHTHSPAFGSALSTSYPTHWHQGCRRVKAQSLSSRIIDRRMKGLNWDHRHKSKKKRQSAKQKEMEFKKCTLSYWIFSKAYDSRCTPILIIPNTQKPWRNL